MSLKQSMTKQLESKTKEVLAIDEKIQNKLESLDSAQESFKKHASEQIEDNIKELRLDSWQSSLREAQASFIERIQITSTSRRYYHSRTTQSVYPTIKKSQEEN